MNTWEDANVVKVLNTIGKDRLVFAGLGTSVCVVGPTLSTLEQVYEVCFVSDACSDVSIEAYACRDSHDPGRRASDDVPAIPPGIAARLRAHRDLGHHDGHRQDPWRLLPTRRNLP